MKIILLCAILAALCGSASAQSSYDAQRENERFIDQMAHDREMLDMRSDFERQLREQSDDAHRQLDDERYRSMMDDVGNNFGCDIHNHCR